MLQWDTIRYREHAGWRPQRQHHILTSAHPSPLSASRGFMGNDHFKKCNEWLERQYGEGKGIDWTSVSKEE